MTTADRSPDALDVLAREIRAFPEAVASLRVTPDVTAAEIRAHLAEAYPFDAARPLDAVLPDVARMLRDWSLHVTHPRYFGLFNPAVHPAAVCADALAALYNPQLAAWAHSPAGNEIERHTLAFVARALGLDPAACAMHFTTGGNEANQTALVAALSHVMPAYAERGAAALGERPAVYVSTQSHHSFHKCVRVSGLGEDALRVVPHDDRLRMDAAALRARIDADRAAGWRPVLVVATAGTTGAGIIDDLDALADVAAACGAWYHVDAAWGGAAALSPRLRGAVRGVERADSVTCDAHKWLSVPMGAGMFFTRHPEVLRHAFDVEASYVPPDAPGREDLYRGSLQWSRRFIGLKLFMTLATLGADGMAAALEHQADMGDLLRARLRERGWIVVNDTPLPLACFTHPRIRAGERTTAAVVSAVQARGHAWISDVALTGDERVLRACITNYKTVPADLEILLDELDRALAG
ncbi:Pyridoxal-dependent decarboxylase (plasmid) [Gemmatirosa kalamazoonensis]|uniref:Pyridoxal-dependent decarboxylase n=1 Tax=Gemmatirosa kalamazoonensis TaxID=861299 RepID=W0RTC3_9BACT|nr:pyridoxal-dependent decarboxylase [Gemmatirosa kalamazoonensis]AHG93575.1 Pyridoxal-dependent decarboxylase [Gemmatirosa kalamazoonensis]